jgi:hypothetical protein
VNNMDSSQVYRLYISYSDTTMFYQDWSPLMKLIDEMELSHSFMSLPVELFYP